MIKNDSISIQENLDEIMENVQAENETIGQIKNHLLYLWKTTVYNKPKSNVNDFINTIYQFKQNGYVEDYEYFFTNDCDDVKLLVKINFVNDTFMYIELYSINEL